MKDGREEEERRASSVWQEFERGIPRKGEGGRGERKGISIEEMDETEEKKFHWKKPREEAVSLFKKKKKTPTR